MAQLNDACTLLDEDHIKVERLLLQYKTAPDASRKRVLAQEIRHELVVHMQIEEEVFYPAFRQKTGDEHRVEDSEREHRELRELLGRVESAHPDDRLMLELEDAVLHHVNDEREKMFPEARKAFSAGEMVELVRQLQARKLEVEATHPA